MQKITPHLWFDKEAREAAEFYTSVFNDSKIDSVVTLHNTPSGSVDIVSIKLLEQDFTLISAGPLFKFTPAISFLVMFNGKKILDSAWRRLVQGGKVLMDLGEYPFSEKYGWLEDKYGLSWQLMFSTEAKQKIIPTLMFSEGACGKAEEAIHFYTTLFSRGSGRGDVLRYGADEDPDEEGTIKHAAFTLCGQEFAAMDSARVQRFTFNEAISFVVHCEKQTEIDYYWEKLSAVPESEQCGWLKDRFGVSWQIAPNVMEEMLKSSDVTKVARVTEAFLKMKKFDIAELKKAYDAY